MTTDIWFPESCNQSSNPTIAIRSEPLSPLCIQPPDNGLIQIGLIVLLVFADTIGWLASLVMRTDAEPERNIVVGIVGPLVAGFGLNPLVGGGNIMAGNFCMLSLLVSFLGPLVLLAIVNLFPRGSAR